MKLRIGICEDENLIAKKLKRIISECLEEIGQEAELFIFLSGEALLEEAERMDVVFLDIRMEGLDGYETGKRIRYRNPDCRIIMETGESEHFEEAFEIGALRYIRKPFDKKKIKEALEKVIASFVGMKKIELYKERNRFTLDQRRIKYIRAYNGYTEYYVEQDIFRKELSLNEVETELDSRLFYKVNRQYIVNLEKIKRKTDGKIYIDGIEIPVSRRRKSEFDRVYFDYLFRK